MEDPALDRNTTAVVLKLDTQGLLNNWLLVPNPRVPDPVGREGEPRICMCNKLAGDADIGPRVTFWDLV